MIYIYSHCVSELNLEIHDYINSFYVEQFDINENILNIVTCSKKGLHLFKRNIIDSTKDENMPLNDKKSVALTKYIPISLEKNDFLLIG